MSNKHPGVWEKRKRALRNIPPLLQLVWRAGSGWVTAAVGLRIVGALMPLAMLAVSKWIIDSLTQRINALPPAFWWVVALEFALAATAAFIGRVTSFCDGLLADRFTLHVSLKVMRHAAKLDFQNYEDAAFQDRLERARVQAMDRISMLQQIGNVLQQLVAAIGLAAGIVAFQPWLLVLMVFGTLPAFLGESHFAFLGYSLNHAQTAMRRQLDYLRTLGASRESAKELKLFGLADYISGEYGKLSRVLYRQNVELSKTRLLWGSLLAFATAAGHYAAYAFVVYQAATQQISIGTMIFLTGAVAGASGNIQAVFAMAAGVADQALFLTDLLEFLRIEPNRRPMTQSILVPRPIRRGLEFENVSFSYAGNSRRILHNISFRIEPGERIALIGENGQGKTTIVKLLTRLYDPSAGRILLDGADLRDYDLEDLHREIGVIFQDFMRYEMTAGQNIAMGSIDRRGDTALLAAAAEKSGADHVIARLPQGMEQLLGRRFEKGVDLSGGEWQKLALARAYLRDAQLLVLDEPTAALDARSEYEVYQRFAELTKDKMALLISHRFSTVRMADRILVLEGGAIAESGNHEQLLRHRGRYAEMFEFQAASYR